MATLPGQVAKVFAAENREMLAVAKLDEGKDEGKDEGRMADGFFVFAIIFALIYPGEGKGSGS